MRVERAVARRPDPWRSGCGPGEGKGPGIGGGQADAVGGGVGHHAVVTAARAAGHPGLLPDVQREAASQPRLLHLCLHLRTRRGSQAGSCVSFLADQQITLCE